ncbi:MAG: DUF3626 domain-containing protein [Candidatus Accumulibacter sp.]|jgi:hypothetical protein|nr:DUF3626 domain-containing protein [Accumulibacter sp.]
MSRIEANPQVQQELQSRGVTDSVGVFGNHQVKIGQQPPVRLDRVRSAPIPFAGFSRATKIERGIAGVDKAGGDALRQLARPGGRLDAKALLGDLKALRAQLNRLNQLGQIAPPPEDAILRAYAPLIQNLSNEELAAVFQGFTSAEMDLLQTGLRHEGENGGRDAQRMRSDLADIQALATKEVSDRVARDMMANDTARPEAERRAAQATPALSERFGPLLRGGAQPVAQAAAPPTSRIAAANVLTLAERSAQGATARERMGEDFAHNLEANALPSMPARAMGDILRAAPLTMNIDTGFLFGASPLLTNPDAHVQNYHHLVRDVRQGTRPEESLPGGMGYAAPRDAAEQLLFPELGEHGADAPDARPAYAALNVNRNEFGAATTSIYGGSHIVFRPEVAQRATYTADDTFYAIPASFTPERRENFYNRLAAMDEGGLPRQFIEEVRNPASELHRAFEDYFDGLATDPNASIAALDTLPPNIGGPLHAACEAAGLGPRDGENYARGALIASFGDGDKARARTATHDSLETLLPGMATPAFNSLARAAIGGQAAPVVGLAGANYIEAQIQGGIVPNRDIAEIRVNLLDIPPRDLPAARERAAAFTQNTGIPVTFFDPDDATRQRNQDEVGDAVTASLGFNAAGHWNQDRLAAEIGALRGNPQAAIDRLLADPNANLSHLPADVRHLQGNALARALNKVDALARKWAENPPANHQLISENALAREAFNEVFKPLLQGKAALLAELDRLPFDNAAQKEAFVNWVMSAQALSSPEELRLIHANATRQAETLRAIADADPPLSPEAVAQRFAETMRQGRDELAAFFQRQVDAGIEFGAEDKTTEINRIAFMSLSLLRNAEGGEATLARLAGQMTAPDQLALAGQMKRLEQEASGSVQEGENRREFDLLATTNLLMELTRDNLCRETGRPPARTTPFIGELSLLPESARTAIESIAVGIAGELERSHPAYPAFPAPANPAALPQNEATRRQFLVDLLRPDGAYVSHERTFEHGTSVHGRGHIARAWVFAEAMCNITEEMGIPVDRNAVLCGIAGHDMGRRAGGPDYWEGRSAAMLTTAMDASYGAENLGEAYQREVENSIDAHRSQTLEGLLLNAADSLDIGRTADFDPERFAFLHGRPGETPLPEAQRMRQQLAREADLLQRLTDPLCQVRPVLGHLANEAADSPFIDTLMEQSAQIKRDVTDAYERRWNESGEAYVQSVENAIRRNPDLFPVLNRYYTRPMDAAPAAASAAPGVPV